MKKDTTVTKTRDGENTRTGGGKRKNRSDRKTLRREQAIERAEAHAMLTNAEQIAVLTEKGHGHCAEAHRLARTEQVAA